MWRSVSRTRALPATRQGALDALENLIGKEKELKPKPKPRQPSHFVSWRNDFLARVTDMDDDEVLANARTLVGSPSRDERSSMRSAAAVYACKHFSSQKRFELSKDFVLTLLQEEGLREVGTSAGSSGGTYSRAVSVLLKSLVKDGRFLEVLQLASSLAFGSGGDAGMGPILSNSMVQTMVMALEKVGDGDLLVRTWQALVQETREAEGTDWRPSSGTFAIFLKACVSIDTRDRPDDSLFLPGTCTRRALEMGSHLGSGITGHLASILLDKCRTREDLDRVIDLHSSAHAKSKGSGLRDLFGQELPRNQLNAYRDRDYPLMLRVLAYMESVGGDLNPTLVTSLVKALFRVDCSGEGFAALRRAGTMGEARGQRLVSEQPLNALVQASCALKSYWPMRKALELVEGSWVAPSRRSLYCLLRAINAPKIDAQIQRSVYRVLDPSYTPQGGYFLLDTLSYFSGGASGSLMGFQSAGQADQQDTFYAEGEGEGGGKAPPEFFSNDRHVRQMLIFQIWNKFLKQRANRKAYRKMFGALDRADASDALMLHWLRDKGETWDSALVSEIIGLCLKERRALASEFLLPFLRTKAREETTGREGDLVDQALDTFKTLDF